VKKSERIANIIFGLNIISWGILGFYNDDWRFSTVRLCLAILHTEIGLLFLFRAPSEKQAGMSILLFCLPSFLIGGTIFKLAPEPYSYPFYAQMIFVTGTAITAVALASLGSSFAIFPALRKIVKGGLYCKIRHPAYFGEIIMLIGCLTADFINPWIWAAYMAIFPALGIRILQEEKLLRMNAGYCEYCQQVKWRLFPGIW